MRAAMSMAGAVVGLLWWCTLAPGAPVSPGCVPAPLPATPGAPAVGLDAVNFSERMHLDVWRQPCLDGSGTVVLMRATPTPGAFLCSGDFTLLQGGLEHNAVLSTVPGGPRVCSDLAEPTTLIVDGAAGAPVSFDAGQGFALVFAGWDSAPRKFQADVGPAGAVPVTITAAVLPASRSVQLGHPMTAFAALVASGASPAVGCTVAPITGVPAGFAFWLTDRATNAVTSAANTPATIQGGDVQTFLLAFTPTAPFAPTALQLDFSCGNTPRAAIIAGVNTLLLSAAPDPVPDVIALAATPTGDGIVNVPTATGTAAFAVSTVNVGSAAAITVSADTGASALPVSLNLCRTDPASGQCVPGTAPAPGLTVVLDAGETSTFSIFVKSDGPVPFDPAASRIFVRFQDDADIVRGATSVAVRTP